MKILTSLVALAALAGCRSLGVEPIDLPLRKKPESKVVASEAAAQESEPKLYARDGSVVDAKRPGTVTLQDTLGHDLSPTNGGRMYILELYQKVIDERDGLQLEVKALRKDNERSRAALAEAEARVTQLQADLDRAMAEKQSLIDENLELAGRLTTAQIRRLEAEQMLLESRIREARESVIVDVEPESDR